MTSKIANKIASYVKKYASKYDIKVYSPIIAQAILESGDGESELAVNANNFFGLKYKNGRCPTASGIYQKVGSEQNKDGSYSSSKMNWCMFKTMEDCVVGYFDFISDSRYSKLKGVTDPETYLTAIKAAGYATSLNYVKNLMRVIEDYNLTKYDPVVKEEKTMSTKVIALDAGHGLYTAGKQTPDGIKEWELNDKVRDKVVSMLSGYDVEFVFPDNNEGSKDESISARRTMYVNKKADAAVSIHHNAFIGTWCSATGVEVFTDRNATAADKELAECIYKKLPNYTGLKGRGIKKANWTVINQSTIPAVLVEGGFMDGKKDYKVITSDEGQTGYAKAIAEGLIEFLELKKKTTTANKVTKKIVANATADYLNKTLAGTYMTTANLRMRNDAGTTNTIMCTIPKGTKVKNYGYYSLSNGVNWLYVQVTLNGVQYTGFCSKSYLKKQ